MIFAVRKRTCSYSHFLYLQIRGNAIFGNETVTFESAVKTRNLELLNVCFLSSCRTPGASA
ncbi:hypothetical protein EMIT0357P_70360 [Pseudomonas marginalis]